MRRILGLTLLILGASFILGPVSAQIDFGTDRKKDCQTCGGDGKLDCDRHAHLKKYVDRTDIYCETCAKKFSCCGGRGVIECRHCLDSFEAVSDMSSRQRAHEEWKRREHPGSVAGTDSFPTIEQVIEKLPGKVGCASTKHFFLFTDQGSVTLETRQHNYLKGRILNDLAAGIPEAVDGGHVVTPHEWLHIHAHRCERVFEMFCEFMALDDETRAAFVGNGIEVAFLFENSSYMLYHQLHSGAFISGETERFGWGGVLDGLLEPEMYFKKSPLPFDRAVENMVLYRGTLAMIRRYHRHVSPGNRFLRHPIFLLVGMANLFEIEDSTNAVYRYGNSEWDLEDNPDWGLVAWNKQILKQVRRRSKAPSVSRLFRLSPSGSNISDDDRIASWSLVSFLHAVDRNKFRQLVALSASLPPAEALWRTYGVSETELTMSWHDWVRKTKGRPGAGLRGAAKLKKSEVGAQFDRLWLNRSKFRLDDRLGAIESLGHAKPDVAIPRLLQAMNDGDSEEQIFATQLIRRWRDPEVAAALVSALEVVIAEPRKEEFLYQLLTAVGPHADQAAELSPLVTEILGSPRTGDLARAAAVRSLGELGDPSSVQVVEAATSDLKPFVRAEATLALAQLAPKLARRSIVEKLINDDSWHVRVASIQILKRLDRLKAVPVLIERLGKENGRLREDILDALEVVSGELLGDDPRSWQTWWNRIGKDLDADWTPVKTRDRYDRTQDLIDKIYSKKCIFLVDVSTSMLLPLGATDRYGRGRRTLKIEYLTTELSRIIKSKLDDDTRFNIFTFATQSIPWKDDLQGSNGGSRKAAIGFVNQIEIERRRMTDLLQALKIIFDAADEAHRKGLRESIFDTIYIVSDGYLTDGLIERQELLDWTRERNRMHRVRINTVTLGAMDADTLFMADLADQNFGKAKLVTD